MLFSPYAQESRNADTLQKSRIRLCPKIVLNIDVTSLLEKNPLRVSIQLWIFRYHDTTGAIDVILLRVGCQQVDHFVGALWICSKFSSVGTGAKIR